MAAPAEFARPPRATGMSEKHRTDDLRIAGIRDLIPPATFIEEIALSEADEDFVTRSRQAVEAIMRGRADRLLVVVGPCSIHDPASALEYARRLHGARDHHSRDLELVIR